jgi:cell division transport system permease protein
MKLVGATNEFIQLPYLINGALYGLFAGIINFGVLYYLIKYISPKIYSFFESQGPSLLNYFTANSALILALEVGSALFIGIVSSFIAVRRYLKIGS